MAVNRRHMPVPADAVWTVLSDAHTYSDWVVGTSDIRSADAEWPSPGSCLYYQIGRGPIAHRGHTEVIAAEAGRRLELEAHAWPVGTARIVMTLTAHDDGCEVTMTEYPARGPAGLLHNRVGDVLIKLRNVEALRRLDRLARTAAGQP